MPGKHRPLGVASANKRMLLHVLALGGGLFALLGAGVVAIEAAATPPEKVTTDTSVTPDTSASAVPSQTVAASIAPTAEPSAPPSEAPPPPTSAAPAPAPTKDKITTMEDRVTALINEERKKAGCGTVRTDERIRKAGRAHSADMAKNNYFSHTGLDGSNFVDRLERAGYPRSGAAGENIAYGYATAEAVVKGWMNSDGHRRNILNCSAKATGVGLAYRGSTPYWTQLFGRT